MTKTARLTIPPIGDDDRIPHEKAVWRVESCKAAGHVAICVEYAGGVIARTYVGSVPNWARVERWRFGWPPA
jgi:hypothetical protein